jgi:hypothetical protein
MYPAPPGIAALRLPRCTCNDNWSFTGFPPARELHINFSINTHLLFTSPPAPLSSRRGGINIAGGYPQTPSRGNSLCTPFTISADTVAHPKAANPSHTWRLPLLCRPRWTSCSTISSDSQTSKRKSECCNNKWKEWSIIVCH